MSLSPRQLLARVRARGRAITPVEPEPPDEHALAMLERARALGAPDPYLLLDPDEASALLGVPLGRAEPLYAETLVGVTCAATASDGRRWAVEVSVLHGDELGFDPVAAWTTEIAAPEMPVTPLDGLGDLAVVRDDGAIAVLVGDRIATVHVAAPVPPARRHEVTTRLARGVAARLGAAVAPSQDA